MNLNVCAAILSFPPGSAGGLDGLRPQILKELLDAKAVGEWGDKIVKALKGMLDLILSGAVPKDIVPYLFGASLTALNKKTGGIRPIAVGCVWRRLAAKVVVHRITPQLTELFFPHQLGVGVKGGAEAGAHAARRFWSSYYPSPRAFLKLDFRNAFNEVYRDSVLGQVATHLPQYYKFVSSAYSNPSHLYFCNKLVLSQGGVQQGDPLGPALLALAI